MRRKGRCDTETVGERGEKEQERKREREQEKRRNEHVEGWERVNRRKSKTPKGNTSKASQTKADAGLTGKERSK